MTIQEFCYWLKGFADRTGEPPTPEEWKQIRALLQQTTGMVPLGKN